jgi:hypothetical protein
MLTTSTIKATGFARNEGFFLTFVNRYLARHR